MTLIRGGQKNEEKDDKSSDGEVEKAAEGVGAESRRGVCIDGFAVLVGWVHFLHGS